MLVKTGLNCRRRKEGKKEGVRMLVKEGLDSGRKEGRKEGARMLVKEGLNREKKEMRRC